MNEGYRVSGYVLIAIGIILLFFGIGLAVLTIQYVTYLDNIFPPEYRFPYLIHGAVIASVGLALLVTGGILENEYNKRKRETSTPTHLLHSFCPYCGAARERDAVYCKICGKKLP